MKDIIEQLCQIQKRAYEQNISVTNEMFASEEDEEQRIKVELRYTSGTHDLMDRRYYCTTISSLDPKEAVSAKIDGLNNIIDNAKHTKESFDNISEIE